MAIVVSRDFRFEDRADGGLLVTDVAAGKMVFVFPPGSNTGFIRGVMRGLMRERRLKQVDRAGLVTVAQLADGALTLTNTSTGRIIELGPGDQVKVHGDSVRLPFGKRLTLRRPVTLWKATPCGRLWTRMKAQMELTEFYEITFSSEKP